MNDITTQYYKFVIDNQSSFIVETTEPTIRGGRAVAGGGRLVENAQVNFEQIISRIPDFINPLRDQIVKGIPQTESVKVEFGFKISGELGIIVAKSQAEANFKVTFVWKGTKAETA
jgi:hypothetical protein